MDSWLQSILQFLMVPILLQNLQQIHGTNIHCLALVLLLPALIEDKIKNHKYVTNLLHLKTKNCISELDNDRQHTQQNLHQAILLKKFIYMAP